MNQLSLYRVRNIYFFPITICATFENMVLRRIFGPRMDEVTGEWRRLHNEELNDL